MWLARRFDLQDHRHLARSVGRLGRGWGVRVQAPTLWARAERWRRIAVRALVASIPVIALGACVPSRNGVFQPVDREVERRLGLAVAWPTDAGVSAAIAAMLHEPLDRDAAVRIALATNRRLQAQYDELGIAAASIAAASVLPPTQVNLAYKLAVDRDGSDPELDVTQDVLALLQLPQRRGIARSELEAARARAVASTIELVARVELAFVDVVAAYQQLELRQTAFDAATASAELAEILDAAGNVPALAVSREQARREQARLDVVRARLAIEVRRETLNGLLGLSGDQPHWTVVPKLPELPEAEPSLDRIEREAVAASLELSALHSDAAAAQGRLGVARVRAWLPELAVGVAAERQEGVWEVGPAIRIGLPLFDQQQGPRARARAELQLTQNVAAATATELRARARATQQRMRATYVEAHHLRTVVLPLRQRVVDETFRQLNAMNASTFELLAARNELVDAGSQYIDALRRYWRAEAEARALARGGRPREGPGEPPTAPFPSTRSTPRED